MAELRRAARLQYKRAVLWTHARRGDLVCRLMLHEHLDDPYPLYEHIRAHGPVYRSRAGVQAVTAHELCSQVLRGSAFARRNEEPAAGPGARTAPAASQTSAPGDVDGSGTGTGEGTAPAEGGGAAGDEPGDTSFLEAEVADHMRWRRLVAPAFRPRKIAEYRKRTEEVAHRLIDTALARGGTFDVVTDFASPLPITVISELLGITDVDVDRFAYYGLVTGRAIDGIRSARQAAEFRAAARELNAMFTNLVGKRRGEPGEDLVSELLRSQDGDQLPEQEIIGTCQLLLTAGFETTTNLVSNAVLRLLSDRSQWEALVGDPGLAPAVAEESLRFDPPVQYSIRVAREALTLGDRPVPVGTVLMLVLGAANRDPVIFPDPHRFDISRSGAGQHLAFLSGAHYCVGAPLARMETDVALSVLAERAPELHRAGPLRRRPTAALRGLLSLPVSARR
ncbi:cytochrome P450 [Streptomyces tubbatahanensis]|uniref:Cytochrome P450 n=1 Tax=Streptomyces tubbatahanensis TaxID=2923272 RepID=A0ABY3XKW3_9ACTN|nr:cytochrome P450 [Streptomyces tubbatahanensis]UNS95066.1 cytochrome P450 [Streptomyces tubbatahanensis]